MNTYCPNASALAARQMLDEAAELASGEMSLEDFVSYAQMTFLEKTKALQEITTVAPKHPLNDSHTVWDHLTSVGMGCGGRGKFIPTITLVPYKGPDRNFIWVLPNALAEALMRGEDVTEVVLTTHFDPTRITHIIHKKDDIEAVNAYSPSDSGCAPIHQFVGKVKLAEGEANS